MKKNIALLGVLSLTALAFSGCSTAHCAATAWEYKVWKYDLPTTTPEPELNALGKDGWSLEPVLNFL